MKNIFATIQILLFCFTLHGQTFEEVSASYGITASYGTGIFGGGVSFCDFNGDGWDDLTFANSEGDSLLFFLNHEGVLQQIHSLVPNTEEAKQVLWVDYDNDGDKDLFVTAAYGVNRLYNNAGNLVLNDVTAAAGLPLADFTTFGAVFGDFDRDGWLDLYLSNRETSDYTNYLFRNQGDGTFMNVTDEANVGHGYLQSFCAAFLDYNLDGLPDIYSSNDKQAESTLFQNMGNGVFENVGASTDAHLFINAMSVTPGDYDGDGDLDIYLTNTAAGNKLLRNENGAGFVEIAEQAGVAMFSSSAWSANFLDLDNDSDLDLYVGDGVATQNNALFLNHNDGTFSSTQLSGDDGSSFSNAIGDFNNDGLPDIAVNCKNCPNFRLWKNENSENHHWLKVELEGTESNRDAIGSWIEVYAGGEKQVRYTHCGTGYLAQNSSRIHFGLKNALVVDSVIVKWLSGTKEKLTEVPVNQTIKIVEGSTLITAVSEISESSSFSISPIFPNPLVGDAIRFEVFSTKRQVAELRVFDPKVGVIIEKTIELHSGENRVKLTDLQWSPGMYFIVLKSQNGFASARVVVL